MDLLLFLLLLAALVLALVVLVQSAGRSLLAWSVVLVAVAVLLLNIGLAKGL